VKEKVRPLKIYNALFFEPHTRCYMLFKKYFSFNFILTGFFSNNNKFVFSFWILGRGARGECPKDKTHYSFFRRQYYYRLKMDL